MKIANGAKAKERIAGNDDGKEWSPPECKIGGVFLVLEQEAPLHNRFPRTCEESSNRKPVHRGAVPRLGLHRNGSM